MTLATALLVALLQMEAPPEMPATDLDGGTAVAATDGGSSPSLLDRIRAVAQIGGVDGGNARELALGAADKLASLYDSRHKDDPPAPPASAPPPMTAGSGMGLRGVGMNLAAPPRPSLQKPGSIASSRQPARPALSLRKLDPAPQKLTAGDATALRGKTRLAQKVRLAPRVQRAPAKPLPAAKKKNKPAPAQSHRD